MDNLSKYWRLVRIDSSGKNRTENVLSAKAFFEKYVCGILTQEKLTDKYIQETLVNFPKNLPESERDSDLVKLAQLCLRCYISNIIKQSCIDLESQFGKKHGFTRYDLYRFVLDEYTPLNISYFEKITDPEYQSPTQEILTKFNPERGNLKSWTIRLVRRNFLLNEFLLEKDVYLIGDWAILNDTTGQQVQNILAEFYTLTTIEVRQSRQLLESYHTIYRRDRRLARQRGFKGPCPPPTTEQLCQIGQKFFEAAGLLPGNNYKLVSNIILNKLQVLADRLREYRIFNKQKIYKTQSLESIPGELLINPSCDREEEEKEFLKLYQQQINNCLDLAIAKVTKKYTTILAKRDRNKADKFLHALYLFHCLSKSMGEIAPQIGLVAQYQVSRFLKLKEFRADIRRELLIELRNKVLALAKIYSDSTQLQNLDRQLEELLTEQIVELIREAETEAKIPQARPIRSLYARRLCNYLDNKTL
jgi:hypothetical protein